MSEACSPEDREKKETKTEIDEDENKEINI